MRLFAEICEKRRKNMPIPNDPVILMSYLNTQLRDFYTDLDDLCKSLSLERGQIEEKLNTIGYRYSEKQNQFLPA